MARLTFIHAADLHLGAPLHGISRVDESWGRRLQDATMAAYRKMIAEALSRAVDFVILAGDTFDAARNISFSQYNAFAEGLLELSNAGIPVYICHGNHDPANSWRKDLLRLPDNVHFFSADAPSYEVFSRDGEPLCVLGGISYKTGKWDSRRNPVTGLARQHIASVLAERGMEMPSFSIGVLHTGLSKTDPYAPVTTAELASCDLDYWALGHIHKRWIDNPTSPKMAQPGCMQGHDINEPGVRGFNIVFLESGKPTTIEFVPAGTILWDNLVIDVSNAETVRDITDTIEANAHLALEEAHFPEALCFRVRLVGTTPLSPLLHDRTNVEDMIDFLNDSADYFCDRIDIATRTPRDLDALRSGSMFAAELLREADCRKTDSATLKEELSQALAKLGCVLPENLDLNALIDEATDDALNRLMGEER